MLDILVKSLDALWQVALAALVLGAGLPALFALGVKSMNSGRVLVASGAGGPGRAVGTETGQASTLGRVGGVVCFAICGAAVLFGIVVIIYGKQLFGV